MHRDRCERLRVDVEQALAAEFGAPVPLRLVVEPVAGAPVVEEEVIDIEDIREAAPAEVTSPIDHVMQAFEGAQVVED